MPQLPGGGGQQAILEAILHQLIYPAGHSESGQVFARFVVDADGSVGEPSIVKGLVDEAYDQAVLAAIRQLPRFEPGRQDGRAVAVSFTVPIEFKK